MAAYAITRELDASFDDTVARITASLAEQGFGVLTTIDVRNTLKKKLDLDVDPYVILGACNPQLARRGLKLEPDLGRAAPLQRRRADPRQSTHIAAMDPFAALQLRLTTPTSNHSQPNARAHPESGERSMNDLRFPVDDRSGQACQRVIAFVAGQAWIEIEPRPVQRHPPRPVEPRDFLSPPSPPATPSP